MRALIGAAACLALLCSLPARAAPPAPAPAEPCLMAVNGLLSAITARIDDAPQYEMRIYAESRARKIIDVVNALPPASEYGGDRVLAVLHSGEEPSAIFFFLTSGCVTHQFPAIPMAVWLLTLQKALGNET